jgi:hypothetical protein
MSQGAVNDGAAMRVCGVRQVMERAMRRLLVPAVALLLLVGCRSQLSSDLRAADAPCEGQKLPTKSALVACLDEKERPVWERESPTTLDAYDSFAKRREELAQQYDQRAIDEGRYKAELGRAAAAARADIAAHQSAAAPD